MEKITKEHLLDIQNVNGWERCGKEWDFVISNIAMSEDYLKHL